MFALYTIHYLFAVFINSTVGRTARLSRPSFRVLTGCIHTCCGYAVTRLVFDYMVIEFTGILILH